MSDRIKSKTRTEVAGQDRREPLPSHPQARLVARTLLTLALVLLALWIAGDFLPVLAITTWPAYVRFASIISDARGQVLAPLTFTLLVGLILFLPVALATYQAAQQGDAVFAWIAEAREKGIGVPAWVAQLPVAADAVQQWWQNSLSDPKAAASWLQGINTETATEWTKAFGAQLLHRMFMFFVSLIALFVLLRSGAWISARVLETADRIFGDPGERLASKMVDAMRGTVNGTVVVAVAEGLVIGAAYFVAGVPNPILFTFLTMAFALLPFGAWAAFTAAALALVFGGGSGWAAVGVFGWGAVVMIVGDHFVWPTLVGGAARLPFLFALVGIFGGLQTFGLIGLVLGPVIMAALLTVWREWLGAAGTPAKR
jgi:predicted PurR-regulated permease PerM